MPVSPNTLTVLVPAVIAALQRVLRQTGSILNLATTDASATGAAVGQTVTLGATTPASTYDVTPGAVPPALVGQTPTGKSLIIEKYKGSRFALTGEDWLALGQIGPNFRVSAMDECIAALINELCAFTFTKLDEGIGYALGGNTNVFAANPNALMDAWEIQSNFLAPQFGRIGCLSTLDWANAGKLAQFQKLNEAPEGTKFSTSQLGMLANYAMTYDQAIKNHVGGNAATWVVTGVQNAGDTSLAVSGGTGVFLPGDTIQIGALTTILYTVKSFAGGIITLNAGLRYPTLAAAPIVNIALARSNMLCHPDTMVLAVRPPSEAPDGDAADQVVIVRDPVTGVALRLAHYKGYHAGQWELSLVYGATVRRPELGVKLLSGPAA